MPNRPLYGLQAVDPQPGRVGVLLGFASCLACGRFFFRLARLLAVAMVRLVVQHHDVLEAQQFAAGAPQHLAFRFLGGDFPVVALEQGTTSPGELHALAPQECVIVGDYDLGAAQIGQHVFGHEVVFGVVAGGIVWLQHAQAIADGDAWGDDQEAASEAPASRLADGIQGLPSNEHCHHCGFAGSGGEFQGDAQQIWVGVFVRAMQVISDVAVRGAPRAH